MKRTQETTHKTKALTISIVVHGAFLLGFYFLVFINSAQLPQIMNQVTFDLKEVIAPSSVPPPNLPNVTKIIPTPPPKPAEDLPKENLPQTGKAIQPDESPVTEKKEVQDKEASPPLLPEDETASESVPPPIDEQPAEEDPASDKDPSTQEGDNPESTQEDVLENKEVDERSLYISNSKKKTGALLELTGWLWDTMPSPQDSSDETGKIVFEIKVDSMGEVISVKTLEKTISASIEKIYKASLEQLTFSKTDEDGADEVVSTGKITFFIRAR